MKEGDEICFWHDHKDRCGKIIKMFTQIGFEDHGKELVVILLDNSRGLFNDYVIKAEKNKLKIIN